MSKFEPKLTPLDQEFFDLLSGLDLEDLRTMRDENYCGLPVYLQEL